ncbi:MAG: IS1595 family transposase [Alphaproteobacteria bacterium]|nr:IS1595 family transposase [Alphaproteobacteria bacterium]QQS57354.1 MAG: IS1595 family transposase [Alphaproteobacteria bacterium]
MNLTDKIYNDEDAARIHLEAIRWPNGVICPICGGTDKIKPSKMKNKATKANPVPKEVRGYYHCGDCCDRFTVRTGMIYERSHIPLHKWVLATHLLCSSKKGMSAHQLHRMLGLTYKSAWFMAHRIREAMMETFGEPMGGEGESVQIDETYFGKKEVVTKRTIRGKPSHSSKMSVVTLVSKGKSRTFHVDTANVATIREILAKNVKQETALHTDESNLYKKVGQEYGDHKTVKHTAGQYVNKGVHVNSCENYFSIFKRGMRGVYQHCKEKHLQRYLNEFDFRYNSRDITDSDRALLCLKGAEGKRLTYRGA